MPRPIQSVSRYAPSVGTGPAITSGSGSGWGLGWCCCGSVTCTTISGNVKGCASANLVSATVELWDSTLTTFFATTSTDSSGNYSFSVAAGSYKVKVSYTGYTTATSGTITVDCTPTTGTYNVTLSVDSSHVCCSHCTGGVAPKTIYATDANGTWTLTNTGTCVWIGTGQVSKHQASVAVSACFGPNDRLDDGGAGTLTYSISVTHNSGNWDISFAADFMCGSPDCANPFAYAAYFCPGASLGASCPSSPAGNIHATYMMAGPTTLSGTCDSSGMSFSGSVGSWTPDLVISPPADSPPVTGSVTVTS